MLGSPHGATLRRVEIRMVSEGYETEAQARVQVYLMRHNLKRLHSHSYEITVAVDEKPKAAA